MLVTAYWLAKILHCYTFCIKLERLIISIGRNKSATRCYNHYLVICWFHLQSFINIKVITSVHIDICLNIEIKCKTVTCFLINVNYLLMFFDFHLKSSHLSIHPAPGYPVMAAVLVSFSSFQSSYCFPQKQ